MQGRPAGPGFYPSLPGEGPPGASGRQPGQPQPQPAGPRVTYPAPYPGGHYAYAQQQNAVAYPPPQHQEPVAAALQSYGSGSVTLVRVRLPDEFRIDPPIPVSAALLAGSSQSQGGAFGPGPGPGGSAAGLAQQPTPPLDKERELLAKEPTNCAEAFFRTAEPLSWQAPSVTPFVDMGYTPLQASLGVVFTKDLQLGDAEVPDFASNLSELMGAGYSAAVATGALAIKKNDLVAATELCLAASK